MTIHDFLWRGLLPLQVLLGLWALWLGFRRQPLSPAFFSGLVVDEVLLVLQGLLGLVVFAEGHRPEPLHFLYGGLVALLLPIVYYYTNERSRAGIWLGLTLLFMAGLIIRAFTTRGA
jgi:hypothetical protein